MQSEVEGEPISPDELVLPGWTHIRQRQQAFHANTNVSVQTGMMPPQDTHKRIGSTKKKPPRRVAPLEPLPPTDIKVVMRPRGGLALATIPVAALADAVQTQAGIEVNSQDQVRINSKANFIVVSTPCEKRATQYVALNQLFVGE